MLSSFQKFVTSTIKEGEVKTTVRGGSNVSVY